MKQWTILYEQWMGKLKVGENYAEWWQGQSLSQWYKIKYVLCKMREGYANAFKPYGLFIINFWKEWDGELEIKERERAMYRCEYMYDYIVIVDIECDLS